YLDVPLQHASPRILKAMKRPANIDNTLQRIKDWREICPEITLRSTFITGFPGETEQDFDELLAFLREARLDRVGAFTYSAVEGADANALADPVADEVKQDRLARLMTLQAQISSEKLAAKVGREITVLVDGYSDDGLLLARSAADAPEVDGVVILDGVEETKPGEFLKVTVTGATEHDLIAE
ncbi:MAG TPA: radical SAM protein, partial [Gammaproteobacteria bacterium]|nr:radical SAM protein [Gammaproteobacteria bacterium]